MKKSEVLKILGSYVINNFTELILNEKWLVVEVTSLTEYHMALLHKYILSIQPTDAKSMMVYFCRTIECD